MKCSSLINTYNVNTLTTPRWLSTGLESETQAVARCQKEFKILGTTTTTQHLLNGLFSRPTWVSRHQKGKTSLDLNEARDDGVFGMAVASAGPYANSLHLAADR